MVVEFWLMKMVIVGQGGNSADGRRLEVSSVELEKEDNKER